MGTRFHNENIFEGNKLQHGTTKTLEFLNPDGIKNPTMEYQLLMYLQLNPDLNTSRFTKTTYPVSDSIINFRLGSHSFPIETER